MSLNLKSRNCLPADILSEEKTIVNKSVFDALPNSAYVREAQLVRSSTSTDSTAPLPFSAPTLWRKVKAGTFPKPVRFSSRVTCWNVGTIRAWMATQEALTYKATVITRKQVKRTVAIQD